MNYTPPKVFVYQEYAHSSVAAQQADLIPCIVGPCYYIVDGVDYTEDSYVREFTDGYPFTNEFLPSIKLGTIIDPTSIIFNIGGNPLAEYKKDIAVSSVLYNGVILTLATLNINDAEIGDTVNIRDSATKNLVYTSQIVNVDVATKRITLNSAFTSGGTGTYTVDILRNVDKFNMEINKLGINTVPSVDEPNTTVTYTCNIATVDMVNNTFTLGDIYIRLNGVFCKLVKYKLYLTYKAREVSKNYIIEIDSTTDKLNVVGKASKDNPLGLATALVSANMSKVPVKVFATVDDTLDGWNEALSALSNDQDIYSVIPLTQDPAIISMFKEHCVAFSNYDISLPRVCLASAKLNTFGDSGSSYVVAEGTCQLQDNNDNILNILIDTSGEANFITKSVSSGDSIYLYADDANYSVFPVAQVPAENILSVSPTTPFSINSATELSRSYTCLTSELDGYSVFDQDALVADDTLLITGTDADSHSSITYVMFPNFDITKDSTITEAALRFMYGANTAAPAVISIYGVVPASSLSYPTTLAELNALTLTTAKVDWSIVSGSKDIFVTTPDVSSIISEIISDAAYTSGSSIMFVLKSSVDNTDGGIISLYSSDYLGGAYAPYLSLKYSMATFTTATNYAYKVIHKMSVSEQAIQYRDLSKSLSTTTRANMVNIWPPRCVVSGLSGDAPGYYLAAAVGGLVGQLPSQQSFSKLSVAGISSLSGVSGFSAYHLDVIASGGTFIFTQANPSSVPMIRHQLTTNMDTIEFREFSFVKNYDYVALTLKKALDGFVGKYNITPRNLLLLSTVLKANMDVMVSNNQPVVGPPILNYNIVSVAQSNEQRDRVEIYVNILFPYVLNYIGLHLVSQ